ncbi:glycosyltransferase family 4 protein [Cognatiluteimonas weifangensis]|uniref:Glycosyltransferase n=1 Tax=Cognatiluteimonas weifangensis TaxID=2303539 RepID=A0A372DLW4_9GAMM|nr:glycosyltransferase family 4 protein [Luteimonas weifangensis]RFP60560.1 glycosyltransferase [Luteimonas weifangensis]
MNILITSVQVPFVRGGGEILAQGLLAAIKRQGHRADILTAPFRFSPASAIEESADWWGRINLASFCAGNVDKVIHLKFPCFYAQHPDSVLWLLHQHRAYYELWDEKGASGKDKAVRKRVIQQDTDALLRIPRRFTIAKRVSARLQQYNGVSSAPIYHPPFSAEQFRCEESLPFIFSPSRLEPLKRQMLLVEAMAKTRSPMVALIAGEGGAAAALNRRISELGIESKVRLLGYVCDREMRSYYAKARAIFFGPYDEDYGYVTLESMLASKPVITCTDSGGPLEFVVHGETGQVVEPVADVIAQAIDRYGRSEALATAHGQAGRAAYDDMDISWDPVVERLLK